MIDIFNSFEQCAVEISRAIDRDSFGYSSDSNSSGDQQLQLDVEADQIVEKILSEVSSISEISSEEREGSTELNSGGEYLISYDPLDGSSLVDVNLSVGTIFGVYKDEFHPSKLVASAYIVYGPRTEIVRVVEGEKPKLFRLAGDKFHFVKELQLSEKGKLNASGGTQNRWFPHHKALIESLFSDGYRLRYSGGMVPDLHQILLKGGGLFSYPATTDKPKGKLRLLFEVLPFALIYESAGGNAIADSGDRLLEVVPESLHDTSSCFFGSKSEIERVKEFYS
jgi:fructose-1,6-bisphosphatase I